MPKWVFLKTIFEIWKHQCLYLMFSSLRFIWQTFDVIIDVPVFDLLKGLCFYLWGGAVRTVLCRTRACDELKVRSEIIHDKYLFDYLRLSWIWIVWRRLLDCCKCCNWSRFVSIIWNREWYWKSGEHMAVDLIIFCLSIKSFDKF